MWVSKFASYTEYSVSDAGLHTIIRANPSRSFKNDAAGRELYACGRNFTFTGKVYGEPQPINERQDEAEEFIAEYAPGKKSGASTRNQSSAGGQYATWDALRAELGRRIIAHESARKNTSGNYDCRGIRHDGECNKGLFYDPAKNQAHCNKGCDQAAMLRAFDLPASPASPAKSVAKKTTTGGADTGTEPEPETEAEESEKAADVEAEGGKQSLSATLITFALEASKLFHDAGGDCYVTVKHKDHEETYKIGSRAHKDWLAALLYRETQQAARTDVLTDTVTILRVKALYDGEKMEAHVRLAEHDGAIYLDLCNDKWEQVRITESCWEVIKSEDSPVRFVRAKGMLALSTPSGGGSVDLLRDLLNLAKDDKDNWPLIAAWLVATFKPNGDGFDYPLLGIHGEQGSGKSTAQRLLRDLIDPNKATLRAAPRDEGDLAIAASHGRIISCDNLTHISEPYRKFIEAQPLILGALNFGTKRTSGDRLDVDAPDSVLTDDLLATLRARKAELLDLLADENEELHDSALFDPPIVEVTYYTGERLRIPQTSTPPGWSSPF